MLERKTLCCISDPADNIPTLLSRRARADRSEDLSQHEAIRIYCKSRHYCIYKLGGLDGQYSYHSLCSLALAFRREQAQR